MRVSYRRLHPNESGVKEELSTMVSRICIDMVEPSVRSSLTCVETSALNKSTSKASARLVPLRRNPSESGVKEDRTDGSSFLYIPRNPRHNPPFLCALLYSHVAKLPKPPHGDLLPALDSAAPLHRNTVSIDKFSLKILLRLRSR